MGWVSKLAEKRTHKLKKDSPQGGPGHRGSRNPLAVPVIRCLKQQYHGLVLTLLPKGSLLGSLCSKFKFLAKILWCPRLVTHSPPDPHRAWQPVSATKTGFRRLLTGKWRCCHQKIKHRSLHNRKHMCPVRPLIATSDNMLLLWFYLLSLTYTPRWSPGPQLIPSASLDLCAVSGGPDGR